MERIEDATGALDDKMSITMSRIERRLETLESMVGFVVKVICCTCHEGDWFDFLQSLRRMIYWEEFTTQVNKSFKILILK